MKNLFRDRLKELREEKGLNLEELSNELGGQISRAALGRWEQGTRKPGMDNIITLAKYFKVSADYLLGLSDY